MFFSSSATCCCTTLRNALKASTSGGPSSVVRRSICFFTAEWATEERVDHVRVAQDLADHRIERGLLGVVVRLEFAHHLADDSSVRSVVESREQRVDAAMIGEDEVNSVRHFRPPVPGHESGACPAVPVTMHREVGNDALGKLAVRLRGDRHAGPGSVDAGIDEEILAVAPSGDRLEVPVRTLHPRERRWVVGESGTCGNDDRVGLGGAGRVERPVDREFVGPPSRSRDRALVGGDDVWDGARRDRAPPASARMPARSHPSLARICTTRPSTG